MSVESVTPLHLEVHGARGSTSVSGKAFIRYGGNTTCYSIALPDDHHLLIDCGSGIGRFAGQLRETGGGAPFEATILLTHFHWDHIQGLPGFAPLHDSRSRLHIIAAPPPGQTIEETLDAVIRPPWFPVRLRDVAAKLSFEALPAQGVSVGPLEIRGAALHHPGGVTGYRLQAGSSALVVATDVETGEPAHDRALRALAEGASTLVHDAQYTPPEYDAHRGWGHSTWEHATDAAREAGVKRLTLTSHDPGHSDEDIDAIVEAAREHFPATHAAFEGMRLEL